MSTKRGQERRCSYVVLVTRAAASMDGLRDLAEYLSTLAIAGCEVVILDPSPRLQFDINARVLRWVGRHVAVGTADVVRAAPTHAACEKVIVAADDVRYTAAAVDQLCALLEAHEVVEPQDYLDPMPWWGGIDAGRILLHRGIEPRPDHGATFAFRRGAMNALRAEAHPAADVFVRRAPGSLGDWLSSRPRLAGDDFELPVKTVFFFSLFPLLVLVALAGGLPLAGGYAGVIAFASVALALRGRAGASPYFPLRACLFAPLWVLERSLSVYWALLRKLRGTDEETAGVHVPDRAPSELSSARSGNST